MQKSVGKLESPTRFHSAKAGSAYFFKGCCLVCRKVVLTRNASYLRILVRRYSSSFSQHPPTTCNRRPSLKQSKSLSLSSYFPSALPIVPAMAAETKLFILGCCFYFDVNVLNPKTIFSFLFITFLVISTCYLSFVRPVFALSPSFVRQEIINNHDVVNITNGFATTQ